MKEIIQGFVPAIQDWFIVTGILGFSLGTVFLLTDLSNTDEGIAFRNLWFVTAAQCLISWIILYKAPEYVAYIVPLFVLVCIFKLIIISTAEKPFPISEYSFLIMAWVFNMSINVPHLMKLNSVTFFVGCVIYIARAYYIHCTLPFVHILILGGAAFQYIFGWYSAYYQFKQLNNLVIVNERQANEMKKILEIFPESVLIHSEGQKTQKSSFWANNQFEERIIKIQESINELDQVLVRTNIEINEDEHSKESIEESMKQLMHKHRIHLTYKNLHEFVENIEVGFYYK